jgi:hypothetical protein
MSKAYALKRIDEVSNELKFTARKKYTAEPLHFEKKLKLVKAGKVPFHKEISHYTNFDSLYDFSEIDPGAKAYKQRLEAETKIDKHVSAIKDELMLGDLKVATRLIEELRNFKV